MTTIPLAQRWNPYTRYTVFERELRDWLLVFGARAMYDGKLWQPQKKRLAKWNGESVVEVWFVETLPG